MGDFKAKIVPDKHVGNVLSITNNGYQWSGVSIKTDEDIEEVIRVLNEYMDEKLALNDDKA